MAIQTWRRLGHVFVGAGETEWMAGYASYPTPLVIDDEIVRVFFSPRDRRNRSSITALDLRLTGENFSIAAPPETCLLSPGEVGCFDDSGVTVAAVVADGGRLLVYYLGWSLGVTVPFRTFVGLAVGVPGTDRLERLSPAPVLDRSPVDPYALSYPWVLQGKDGWRMWYGSYLNAGSDANGGNSTIKEARSADGVAWHRDGTITIPLSGGRETAISRPCVVVDRDCERMWYARKDRSHYRIGYAESFGQGWIRRDDELRFVGTVGEWESESIEYPAVFDHGGRRYMLYNGNGYGRTGFGLAILEG
jgi:hypothetical protein